MADRWGYLMARPDAKDQRYAIGAALAKRLVRRHGSVKQALHIYDTWNSASLMRSIKATQFEADAALGIRDALIAMEATDA